MTVSYFTEEVFSLPLPLFPLRLPPLAEDSANILPAMGNIEQCSTKLTV